MSAPLDRYAVVGTPVAHSRSPFIHARFAEQTGQALHYERLLAPLDAFAETVRRFAAEGGRGCNVTVPFKFEAVALASHRTERAALAQAANALRFDAGGWLADNTDGIGLVRDIQRNAGVDIASRSVLLIGAGGASAGVLGPLLEQQPARVVVANRTLDKAEALVRRHAALAADRGAVLAACALEACGGPFDIVLNASASSLAGAGVPVDSNVLRPGTLAVDLMYGSAAQPFLQWTAEHGAPGRDGLGMLVEQAAEAFWLWRGVRPDTTPVLAEVRRRVDRGLP
jgi:shikimate dehydrogenase